MGILSVNLLYTGRSGSDSLLHRRTYSETYEVVTDSVATTEQDVANAPGIPQRGMSFVRDAYAIVTDVEVSQSEDTPFLWHVSIKYDSKPDFPSSTDPDGTQNNPEDLPENPLLRPATWKITFGKTSEVAEKWFPVDDAGNLSAKLVPVINSAGLPFDPPAMMEVSRPVIRVTKNVPVVSLEYLLQLEDAVNDRPWRNLPKWVARVDGVDASNKYENGVAYVELTIDVMLKRETWLLSILDYGTYELTQRSQNGGGVGGLLVPKWTATRDPMGNIAPVPLDGKGHKLTPGADPVFLRGLTKNYHLEDFNSLLPF